MGRWCGRKASGAPGFSPVLSAAAAVKNTILCYERLCGTGRLEGIIWTRDGSAIEVIAVGEEGGNSAMWRKWGSESDLAGLAATRC